MQIPLTPELTAAVHAGGGFAQVEDPNTHRVYFLIEQTATPTIDDNYVREKIAEAYADGEFQPLDPGDSDEALAKNRRIELKLTER